MMKFKQLRERARKQSADNVGVESSVDATLPTDPHREDNADENSRNVDGDAENQVEKSVKPVYKKQKDGSYSAVKESRRVNNLKSKMYNDSHAEVSAKKKWKNRDFDHNHDREVDNAYKKRVDSHIKKNPKDRKHFYGEGVDEAKLDPTKKKPTARELRKYRDHPRGEKDSEYVGKLLKTPDGKPLKSHAIVKAKRAQNRNEEYDFNLALSENTIDDIKKLSSMNLPGKVKFADGSVAQVSPEDATAILQVHGNVNDKRQIQLAKKLSSGTKEFAKVLKFARNHSKVTGRLRVISKI